MTYPPPGPAPKPPLNRSDAVGSTVVLVLAALLSAGGAVTGLLVLAFLDYCPPESCSVDGAVTSMMATVGAVALVFVVGLVLTVIRLRGRKTAWPVAVGTLVLCGVVFAGGALAYSAAVGW